MCRGTLRYNTSRHFPFSLSSPLTCGILSPFSQLPEIETSASKVICEMYNIQDILITPAQTALRTMDEAHIATSPQEITIFPVDSYVLARYNTQPPT